MPDFEFATIKVVPHNTTHHDPINIGVILYDPDRGIAFRKITNNWPEVRRRTGFRYNPGKNDESEQGPFEVGRNYLRDLAENQFRDSMEVTPPKILSHFETHKEALDWLYSMEVGLPQLDGRKNRPAERPSTLLDEKIAAVGFPRDCYKKSHEFDLGRPTAVRFPNVFFRDDEPYMALFAVSLAAANLSNTVKARLCEVHAIREWSDSSPTFAMCAIQAERQVDRSKLDANTFGLLDKLEVETVYWDGLDSRLQEIKRAVSPLGIVQYGG